jgi:uncharacterized membrane-anchored protein
MNISLLSSMSYLLPGSKNTALCVCVISRYVTHCVFGLIMYILYTCIFLCKACNRIRRLAPDDCLFQEDV